MQYLIKKGNHYASPRTFSLHSGVMAASWLVRFDSSCYYSFGTDDDKDWNKLCGWTLDLFGRNSLRIGWRPADDGNVELVAYLHRGGKRYTVKGSNWRLGKYPFNSWVEIGIEHDGETAVFSAKPANTDNVKVVRIGYKHYICAGYWSNVYFGGNNAAPHDMVIELLKLK